MTKGDVKTFVAMCVYVCCIGWLRHKRSTLSADFPIIARVVQKMIRSEAIIPILLVPYRKSVRRFLFLSWGSPV
jgi:hypothetical protein